MKRTLIVLALVVFAPAAIGALLLWWAIPRVGAIGSVSVGITEAAVEMIAVLILVLAILAGRALLIRRSR